MRYKTPVLPAPLICDTREHWTHGGSKDAHIRDWLERYNIPYVVQKLDVGDYALPGGTIAVDRKQNLDEVSKNLTNPADSSRFMREVRRAHAAGIHLVVLVEHGRNIKTMDDVRNWTSVYTGVHGNYLARQMHRLELAYKVRWDFCDKRTTARKIIEILTEQDNKHNKQEEKQ